MVPPVRITPWSTPHELHTIFALLFSASSSPTSQRYALNRIAVWVSRGGCPHPIESTASLLGILLDDDAAAFTKASLRQAYGMALTRFVNTTIDPLQQNLYARSMASLAAELGLPLWFVELRHAATHEDLPPLGVLRDAARQALDHLYITYWLPLSSPSQPSTSSIPFPSPELLQDLKTYKALTKTLLRDNSRTSSLRPRLEKVLKTLEKVDVSEMLEGLGRIEGLVPLSKKKRPPTFTLLPPALLNLWLPLLTRLSNTHEAFQELLLEKLVSLLSTLPSDETSDSYLKTVTAWIFYFLSPSPAGGEDEQDEEDDDMLEKVVQQCLLLPSNNSMVFLELLVASRPDKPDLEARMKMLLNFYRENLSTPVQGGSSADRTDEGKDVRLEIMERRLRELEASLRHQPTRTQSSTIKSEEDTAEEGLGWKVVENWTPCPIGALPAEYGGRFEALDLPVSAAM